MECCFLGSVLFFGVDYFIGKGKKMEIQEKINELEKRIDAITLILKKLIEAQWIQFNKEVKDCVGCRISMRYGGGYCALHKKKREEILELEEISSK